MTAVKILKADEQDFDLLCECCANRVAELYVLPPDPFGSEPILVCFNTYMKEMEQAAV
jgi:hypothetical protein